MKKNFILFVCLSLCVSCLQTQVFAKMSSESNKLYNSAIVHEQEGNLEQALFYIQKALKYSPDDAVLNIKLAGLYSAMGKYTDAVNAYNKAITLRPEDGFLYISLANLYMQAYDYKNALTFYEKAQALMPEYKYNYINIANAKILLGDNNSAILSYEQFLSVYPENLEAQVAIANIYLEQSDYDKAIEKFALALRNNPSLPSLFFPFVEGRWLNNLNNKKHEKESLFIASPPARTVLRTHRFCTVFRPEGASHPGMTP